MSEDQEKMFEMLAFSRREGGTSRQAEGRERSFIPFQGPYMFSIEVVLTSTQLPSSNCSTDRQCHVSNPNRGVWLRDPSGTLHTAFDQVQLRLDEFQVGVAAALIVAKYSEPKTQRLYKDAVCGDGRFKVSCW